MNALLWIDDLRDPDNFINTDGYDEVVWTKTYDGALVDIKFDYDVIHLDNDLSDEQDRQGKHLFNAIEEWLDSGLLKNLNKIVIHSDNSSAVRNMMLAKERMLEVYGVTVEQMVFKSHN